MGWGLEEAEGGGGGGGAVWRGEGGGRHGGGRGVGDVGKEIKTGVLLVPPERDYTFYLVERL